jgi:hypothetical protein
MNKKAQAGRYGEGIPTSDLEAIYEWTYKLQMLEQEERFGDYGVPQILPDRAYMEKARIEPLLQEKLDEIHDRMIEIYDDWIEGHEPDPSEYYDYAVENWREKRWEIENGHSTLSEVADWFGDNDVLETVIEYLEGVMEEEGIEEIPDAYDEWIKYLDSIKAKKAQQRQFEFMDEEEVGYPDPPKPLREMTLEEIEKLPLYEDHEEGILDEIEKETYWDRAMDEMAEQEMEWRQEEEPYGDIKSMREAMDEWDNLSFSDKIILFQEALTTMHNNGEMAMYLLDDEDAVEILNTLSEGPDVPEWDYELTRMLGYPPGSRLQSQAPEWFVPAAIQAIASVLEMLESSMKKIAVIRKCKKGDAEEGKPWCLYTHDGSKLLGRHPSRESAEKQEAAIKAQGRLAYFIKAVDWERLREEYGEHKEEHMPDPDEGLDEAIYEEFLEMSLDDFLKYYLEEYYKEGLIPEEDLEYFSLFTEAYETAAQITDFEQLKQFLIENANEPVGKDLLADIAGDIAWKIVNDSRFKEAKEEWKDHLTTKFMSPEELYGGRR